MVLKFGHLTLVHDAICESPLVAGAGELRLLLAASRVPFSSVDENSAQEIPGDAVDGDRLLGMAAWHGLAPLLLRYLEQQPNASLPDNVLPALRQSARQAALHNLALASELLSISRHLRAREIEHLAYKGPLLASHLYGTRALRVSADLDIVVPRQRLLPACQTLAELGFVDKIGFTSSQRAAAFRFGFEHTFSRGGIDVDLHWRLVPTFVSPSLDERGVWQRAVEAPLFGAMVPTLCPEDLLLALCLHAGQHEWMHLSSFCDLHQMLILHPRLRWEIVRRHLGDSNTARTVLVSLCLLRKHWNSRIPEDFRERISSDSEVQRIANTVESNFWPASDVPVPRDTSIGWLLQRTRREPWLDRLRYIAGIALNPTTIDYETFKLPRPLIALYPLFRGARLALQRSRIVRPRSSPAP